MRLDAIQGGGTAVSDDDPILSAIKGNGSRAPKTGTAKASSTDPIMAAIQGASDEPVVPFHTTPNPSGTLTERASRLGKSTLPLGPPKNPKPYDTTQIPINVFTGGAQQPGMRTEEEKRAAGTIEAQPEVTVPGAHGTSVHLTPSGIDSMGKVFLPGANPNATLQGNEPIVDPSRGLIAPHGLMTEDEQHQHPILTGLGQLSEGLTTPENLAILAGTMGFGELPAGARAALSTYFAAQTAKGAVDSYTQGWKAYKRGDNQEAQRLWTLAAGNALFAGTAGAHAVRETGFGPKVGPEPVLPKGTISKPLAIDEATARGDRNAQVNAQAQTGLENVDQAVQAARTNQTPAKTIGAGNERLAPEKPETLSAQVDALAKGTNPVVYFPKGSESIPAPPENSQVTVVAGKKAGAGTYYHSDEITPRQIRDAVKNGTFGELLGHEQTKEEALGKARNSKFEKLFLSPVAVGGFGALRVSEFGFLSSFEFRVSSFVQWPIS